MSLSFDSLIHMPQRQSLEVEKSELFFLYGSHLLLYFKLNDTEMGTFISNCVSSTYLLSEAYVPEDLWSNAPSHKLLYKLNIANDFPSCEEQIR